MTGKSPAKSSPNPAIQNTPSKALEIVEVAAGLVFRNGKLLITQRQLDDHLGGLWEFPGGKREAEESFEECLVRELKEELGIVAEAEELLASVTHSYPEKTVLLNFYRCLWKRNEPQAWGCRAFTWIVRDQLDGYAFPAADAKLIQKLRTTPRWWR